MKFHKILFFLIFFLFIFFIFKTYKDYGMSWDEFAYVKYGNFYLLNFFNSQEIKKVTELQHAVTHGALFDMLYLVPQRVLNTTNDYQLLHLTKALFSSLTLVFLYLTLRLLSGNNILPLFGVVLMIFTPRWLGDIFDNHIDVSTTLLFSIEIFLALRLLKEKIKNNFWLTFLTFSAISAISFSHRTVLLIVPVIFSPFFLLKTRKKDILKLFITAALTFFITLMIVDPALRSFGFEGLAKKVIYTLRFQFARDVLFEGKFIAARQLPWYYLPKWILITTPLLTLILFFLGVVKVIKERKRQGVFILLTLLIPLGAVMILRPVLYDGWRQFLFLVVPVTIIVSLGLESIWKLETRLAARQVGYWKLAIGSLVFIGLLSTGIIMYRLHPYEYVYFNSLVGGLKGAYRKYETDYWSKSYREAVLWLEKNEIKKNKTYKIFSCDYRYSASYYFNSNMKLVDKLSDADYAICFTRWDEDKKIRGKIIYVVEREGVPLSFVKRLK